MKIITVEEHFTDKRIMDANNSFNKNQPPMSPEQTEMMNILSSRAFPGEELLDIEKNRIPFMDANKIDMQVLSYTSPVSDLVPSEDAVIICKQANDILAEKISEHPTRFAGFATLPMANPKAAAQELERCIRDYHFCGALLAGRYQGHFYNEEEFFPIFAKAAELDVPIYFHPAFIPLEIQEMYYMSDAYSTLVGSELASAGYGWHAEVGVQVVRLILSGIFDKLPNLKFISGHWGETIPAFLERMDSIMNKEITGLEKNVSEYYKKHVYLTPSGILSNDQLEYLVKVMGAEHILYAVDYPYVKPDYIYNFLVNSNLTEEQKELIAHGNAERLLKL
ncbi:amidohydrolase [Listeria monocytogenes]|nr:amidohydrolase [Listeria monocytogenes]MCV12403.1 amidohydrolase [Listeria monocytogenes]